MSKIPFVVRIDNAPHAVAEQVSPTIQRVIANNPSKFTYRGTGTYIIGDTNVVVIDPGPLLDSHRDALDGVLSNRTVRAIVVTHCHADHSPLAEWLKTKTGAQTYAIGPHADITGLDIEDFADDPDEDSQDDADKTTVGDEPRETIDVAFQPDVIVKDGETFFDAYGITLTAVWTPGHTSNHLCVAYSQEHALFTGDHIMGWSTTVVSPPDGDMRSYMASLDKVIDRKDAILWPTHGAPVTEPIEFLQAYRQHRLEREQQIIDALQIGPRNIQDLVKEMYVDVAKALHKPARRSVWSHLIKLHQDGVAVVADGSDPKLKSLYKLKA